MNIRLISDFREFFDHLFCGSGPHEIIYRRMSTEGPSKREQLALLDSLGYKTPPHGTVNEVAGSYWEAEKRRCQYLVVYEDEAAHCGEGKRLVGHNYYKWDGHIPSIEKIDKRGELYCTAHVGYLGEGLSHRLLQIGPHEIWLEYKSSDWRSNVDGTVEIIEVNKNKGFHQHAPVPVFAIDFVFGAAGPYAVDLNYAPGTGGTGLSKHLSSHEIFNAIEGWYENTTRVLV